MSTIPLWAYLFWMLVSAFCLVAAVGFCMMSAQMWREEMYKPIRVALCPLVVILALMLLLCAVSIPIGLFS